MNKAIHQQSADNMRAIIVSMVEKANSGHPGGPMGGADFMHILCTEFLTFDPDDMTWAHRDRFFMDAGHLSALLYAQWYLLGKYTKEDVANFRQWESVTPGHPEVDVLRGIENTSGPLGQGHAMGVGAAIAERFLSSRFGDWMSHKSYLYISDGGVQEEISQGAGRIAGHLGLGNIVMFFDSNDIQLSSSTSEVISEDTAMKYRSWGWEVETIDGHDHDQIREVLKKASSQDEKPFLIIGKTAIGKGAVDADGGNFEGKCETHGQPLGNTGASLDATLKNLGADTEDPFAIYPEVAEYYAQVLDEKRKQAAERKKLEADFRANNADLAAKLDQFYNKELPELDLEGVAHKPGIATRAASSNVLAYLAEKLDNMIVASADLSNSDKTDGYLKKTKSLQKGDFSGKFLQAGVSELTMAAIANGMALHGGVIPVTGTFFVFSDYMKPAVRLSAIMKLPVIYIWTHDSFRVGEDGPTHQPVEQEVQIRLLERVKNHSGKRSFLALRPADSSETSVAWKMALESTDRPVGLILSRQNIKDLPAVGASRFEDALQSDKGAYVVQKTEGAEVLLIGNGSEVATLFEASEILATKGVKSNIVSVISDGLFKDQDKSYQDEVINKDLTRIGLTAGLPFNLLEMVGDDGLILGLDHFGFSAPAKVLDEKFGYTGESVSARVLTFLKEKK